MAASSWGGQWQQALGHNPCSIAVPSPSSLKNELEKEIPLGTYPYPKSLKETIMLGPKTSPDSSWMKMQ